MNIRNQQQQGRRRGRGGPRPPGQGGVIRPEQNVRLDNRSRGNAAQQLERYKALARDATQSGDRITAEYYHQYADHYFRVLNENRPRFEEQRPRQDRDWQDRNQTDQDFGGEASYAQAGSYDRDDADEPQREAGFDRDTGSSGSNDRDTRATGGFDRDARSTGNDRQINRSRPDVRDNRAPDGGNDRQPRADRDSGYEQRPRYNDRARVDASSERDSGEQDRAQRSDQNRGTRTEQDRAPRSEQGQGQGQDQRYAQGQNRDATGGDRDQRTPRRDRWNGDQPRRDAMVDSAPRSAEAPDYEAGAIARETTSTANDPALVRDVAPPAEPVADTAPRRGRPRKIDAAPASDDPFATRRAPPKAAQSRPAKAEAAAAQSTAAEPAETEPPKRRTTRRPSREEPDTGAELSLENV